MRATITSVPGAHYTFSGREYGIFMENGNYTVIDDKGKRAILRNLLFMSCDYIIAETPKKMVLEIMEGSPRFITVDEFYTILEDFFKERTETLDISDYSDVQYYLVEGKTITQIMDEDISYTTKAHSKMLD